MRLYLLNGPEIFLYEGQIIYFEFNNPMFDDEGSRTSSFFIPMKENKKTFGIYDFINQKTDYRRECYIQDGGIQIKANIKIIMATTKAIKIFLSFMSGEFNKAIKDKYLSDLNFGESLDLGDNIAGRFSIFKKDSAWTSEDDGFAVFPLVAPKLFEGAESEVIFNKNADEEKPVTIDDVWYTNFIQTTSMQGIVNKMWTWPSGVADGTGPYANYHENFFKDEGDNPPVTASHIYGVPLPFLFLDKIIRCFSDFVKLDVVENIFDVDDDLKKLVVLNNHIPIDEAWQPVQKFNLGNHVPDMSLTDFLDHLSKFLGVIVIESISNQELKITSYKDILNSTEIIDITDKADTEVAINEIKRNNIEFTIGEYADNKPFKYINGYYEAIANDEGLVYDNELIKTETSKKLIFNSSTEIWSELSEDFVETELDIIEAATIQTNSHSLSQKKTYYWYANHYRWNPGYDFLIDIPLARDLEGSTIYNDFGNKMDKLVFLYYKGYYATGNPQIASGHHGTAELRGLENEIVSSKTLHLNQGGIVDKYQNEFLFWSKNRKKNIKKYIDWTNYQFRDFFFLKKYKIDNSIFFVKKIKGAFIAGGITQFEDTELLSI